MKNLCITITYAHACTHTLMTSFFQFPSTKFCHGFGQPKPIVEGTFLRCCTLELNLEQCDKEASILPHSHAAPVFFSFTTTTPLSLHFPHHHPPASFHATQGQYCPHWEPPFYIIETLALVSRIALRLTYLPKPNSVPYILHWGLLLHKPDSAGSFHLATKPVCFAQSRNVRKWQNPVWASSFNPSPQVGLVSYIFHWD